jgi:hypothetical protein
MRIAQISPLMESVPPKLYGGTERIVSYLTEELVKTRSRCYVIRQRRFCNLGETRKLRSNSSAAGP